MKRAGVVGGAGDRTPGDNGSEGVVHMGYQGGGCDAPESTYKESFCNDRRLRNLNS